MLSEANEEDEGREWTPRLLVCGRAAFRLPSPAVHSGPEWLASSASGLRTDMSALKAAGENERHGS